MLWPPTILPSAVARIACARTYQVVPDAVPSIVAEVIAWSPIAAQAALPSRHDGVVSDCDATSLKYEKHVPGYEVPLSLWLRPA